VSFLTLLPVWITHRAIAERAKEGASGPSEAGLLESVDSSHAPLPSLLRPDLMVELETLQPRTRCPPPAGHISRDFKGHDKHHLH
jgi:hypothetical protein